jgi:hypothetical protein
MGATHSHNPEYPDDNWNLYSMIDTTTSTALNVTRPSDAVGIFKPFAHRLADEPELISDADEEIIVIVRFTSPVHIRKIMVIGGGSDETRHPASLKCYVNHENVDFTSVGSVRPSQEFNLVVNTQGTSELTTLIHPFTNVTILTFYFPTNHGNPNTVIKYIGMQGEHTHYRREAVDTVYEVLCNGQDIIQPEGVAGAESLGADRHLH